MRELPSTVASLVRTFVSLVLANWSLALISVALAVTLWLFVTDRQNPTEAQSFGGAIAIKFVNAPNSLAVSNASETTVQLRIEAPKNELQGLRAEDFAATVDLGGAEPGTANFTVTATSSNSRVNITGVTPSRIDVTIETQRAKDVPVRATTIGSPQQGFVAGDGTTEPTSVTVTGAASLIDLVDHIDAEVPIGGARTNVTQDRVTLKPRDARGGDISRVAVNPTTARVTVDIEQKEFSLQFVINPVVSGAPGTGFDVAGIAVDPQLVTVTGPLDVLQSIDAVRGIATEEISIADAREDVVRGVSPVLPQGARLQGSPAGKVKVTITIRPARGEATFQVVPQVRNVASGLILAAPPPAVSVTLTGDVPTLRSITPESIVVIADAAGLFSGIHAVPLQITAPGGTSIVRSDPGELGIGLVAR